MYVKKYRSHSMHTPIYVIYGTWWIINLCMPERYFSGKSRAGACHGETADIPRWRKQT